MQGSCCQAFALRSTRIDSELAAFGPDQRSAFSITDRAGLADRIDRSLIRRAMCSLLLEIVLTNRLRGLQAADWYEKLESQRGALARQIAEFSESLAGVPGHRPGAAQECDQELPTDGWHTIEIFQEYNLALMRGVAGGRPLRWFESANSASNPLYIPTAFTIDRNCNKNSDVRRKAP